VLDSPEREQQHEPQLSAIMLIENLFWGCFGLLLGLGIASMRYERLLNKIDWHLKQWEEESEEVWK
jgi:hypothetical protein